MFATVEVTAGARSPGTVSRVRSLRGYSVFDRSEPTGLAGYAPGGRREVTTGGDWETNDFRQNGRETFRNYCSFEGAITEWGRRGNIWGAMFTAETLGCSLSYGLLRMLDSLATLCASQRWKFSEAAGMILKGNVKLILFVTRAPPRFERLLH